MRLAITGGTGFVGSHLIDAAVTSSFDGLRPLLVAVAWITVLAAAAGFLLAVSLRSAGPVGHVAITGEQRDGTPPPDTSTLLAQDAIGASVTGSGQVDRMVFEPRPT